MRKAAEEAIAAGTAKKAREEAEKKPTTLHPITLQQLHLSCQLHYSNQPLLQPTTLQPTPANYTIPQLKPTTLQPTPANFTTPPLKPTTLQPTPANYTIPPLKPTTLQPTPAKFTTPPLKPTTLQPTSHLRRTAAFIIGTKRT
jgi:hypothetical protein